MTASQPRAVSRLGLTVLVVEDDADLRQVVETALVLEGYNVVVASDGLEAIEKLPDCRPALIVFDVMLPHMDGVMFAQELERRGLRPGIPVVMLSGVVDGRQKAKQVGAEGYLEKPFSIPALLEEVARLTGRET